MSTVKLTRDDEHPLVLTREARIALYAAIEEYLEKQGGADTVERSFLQAIQQKVIVKTTPGRGDGIDLCCLTNAIRSCNLCGCSLCAEHWWDRERDELGIPRLESKVLEGSNYAVCPRCKNAGKGVWKQG